MLFLLEALHGISMRLERYTLLNITTATIYEVVKVMGDIMSVGIRVEWLDQLIRKIHEEQECQELVQ